MAVTSKSLTSVGIALILVACCSESSLGQLQVGFYSGTCPDAEAIVRSVVREAMQSDPTLAAALLRLHFHDCFVNGCDGSILIDKSDGTEEKKAFAHQGVGGFDVINSVKAQLEQRCPGMVSCSDIVALAARDAIVLRNGPDYQVPTGRRDGRVSSIPDAADMPDVMDSVEVLTDKFAQKGLSQKDLVILSGAHTIGSTACFFLYNRLYGPGLPDPSIDPELLPKLLATCPEQGANTVRFPLDPGSNTTFDNHIFRNIQQGLGVIKSDAVLYQTPSTRAVVDSYLGGAMNPLFGRPFEADFVDSIVRMGMIGVNTGEEGEIRRVCSSFN